MAGLVPQPSWFVLPCTEISKTLDTVEQVCAAASNAGIDRTGALIAIGGGVCSDIVTLAASLFRRGISHLRIPTTLIGQIDAGIGLKGGVNFAQRKNYLGCFYPPDAVAVIPRLLATLTRDGVKQGMAEMVKISCTSDPRLFTVLEQQTKELIDSNFQLPEAFAKEAIQRAITAMLKELRTNPFENRTLQRAVDFGHTVAHFLEVETAYTLHHGFAVSVDMAFSCVVGWRLGILSFEMAMRVINLLAISGLPIHHHALTEDLIAASFSAAANHRGGAINLVIPTGLGTYAFLKKKSDLGAKLTREVLDWLRQEQERVLVQTATDTVAGNTDYGGFEVSSTRPSFEGCL
jgi:3-dehydroquinate synthase